MKIPITGYTTECLSCFATLLLQAEKDINEKNIGLALCKIEDVREMLKRVVIIVNERKNNKEVV